MLGLILPTPNRQKRKCIATQPRKQWRLFVIMMIKIRSIIISAGLLVASLTNVAVVSAAMTDPATGIAFAPRLNDDLKIAGVGVRKKGPIKVRSFRWCSREEILCYATGCVCSHGGHGLSSAARLICVCTSIAHVLPVIIVVACLGRLDLQCRHVRV